jgi:hypothetical protein
MAIGFDKLTSEWDPTQALGGIADRLEVGRLRDVRQKSLADININNSDSLIAAGKKLIDARDFEGGLKLLAEGRQLKQAETAQFGQKAYLEWLEKNRNNPPATGSGIVDPRNIEPDPFVRTPAGVGAPRPAGSTVPSYLNDPRSLLPVPGAAPGGPRAEAAPDFENAAPYQVAGPAVAGPTGAKPPVPGEADFGPIPPVGAPSVIPPGTLPAEALQRPAPPASGGGMPPGDPVAARAFLNAQKHIEELRFAPPGPLGEGARKAAYEQARYWLEQAKVPQEKKDWYIENLDRMREAVEEGDPDIRPLTYGQYKLQESTAKGRFESAEKLYEKGQDTRRKMEGLNPALDRLESVLNHPAFTSGAGTETLESAKALFRNSKDFLVANGVPIPKDWQDRIDAATTSTALREVFTSMVNSVIFDKLGSLGAQTSDRDLIFTKETFPSIHLSKEGNRMIIEYYKDVIKKNKELAEEIQGAYGRFKSRGKAFDQHEIDKITTAFWKDPKNMVLGDPSVPDGKGLTDLGRRMFRQDALNKAKYPGGAPVPEPGSGTYGVVKEALGEGTRSDEPRGGNWVIPGSPLDRAGRALGIIEDPAPIRGTTTAPVGGGTAVPAVPRGRLPPMIGPDGTEVEYGGP